MDGYGNMDEHGNMEYPYRLGSSLIDSLLGIYYELVLFYSYRDLEYL